MNKSIVFILITVVTTARAYVTPWTNNNNQLHPVHGLFVKPSEDGTTGDLYVAATEDNGVKTQWLTDQPVNFLPAAVKPQLSKPAYETGLPPTSDDGKTQKRAVISPPIQYAYALPYPSSGDNILAPYPYALPAWSAPSGTYNANTKLCSSDPSKANVPQYSPFQLLYPQMMAAYVNAINVLKDAGLTEDTANSVMSQSSLWSPYAYPMYLMMDPSAWIQSQTTTTSSSKASSDETL